MLVIVMTGPTARLASALAGLPVSSVGTPIEPVATIRPCPCMSRGTLIDVPKPPGLVRVAVVP